MQVRQAGREDRPRYPILSWYPLVFQRLSDGRESGAPSRPMDWTAPGHGV